MSGETSSSASRNGWGLLNQYGLYVVAFSPVVANAIGSFFNILYNRIQVAPLLSDQQMERFIECTFWYNLIVYPIAIAFFLLPLIQLGPTHRALLAGKEVEPETLHIAQRRLVNLPWLFLAVATIGWLGCIPAFPLALYADSQPPSNVVVAHLVTSFLTASLIAVTHSFFAVEIAIQKFLFPVFFQKDNPAEVPDGVPLNIIARGIMWAFSAVVSPVVSLVLLMLLPDAANSAPLFAVYVGIVAIAFGLMTSFMLGKLVTTPLNQLKIASMKVTDGDYNTRVDLLRADDFGLLIDRFNRMVEGLREREHLQQTFGRHVGQEAARQIMSQGDQLAGRQQIISVMFVDVRNFTQFSSSHPPDQVVTALNAFFREAVEIVESHGGMVNKFLGDGFMAIFGIGSGADHHARRAVEAGQAMLRCLDHSAEKFERAGWPNLQIGVGVNTGPRLLEVSDRPSDKSTRRSAIP